MHYITFITYGECNCIKQTFLEKNKRVREEILSYNSRDTCDRAIMLVAKRFILHLSSTEISNGVYMLIRS